MAHAFDNRNFSSGKQRTFYSVVAPPPSSSTSSSSQLSSGSNHHPPSYEESVFNTALVDRQRRQPATDDYFTFLSGDRSTETKPPPPARVPRMASIANSSYSRRPTILSQCSPNGMKTNTTYLNTTQLYITQPSSPDHPPPPPPRYPLHPPAIPPRNLLTAHQKNSITIPDFNSSVSPKTIYRSPVVSSTEERNDFNDDILLEHRLNSLSINPNHHLQDATNGSTVGEYFGDCHKCGETITSLDDPCDILGQIYHGSCAICVVCGRSIKNKHFFMKDQLLCEEDCFETGFQQTLEHCVACRREITDVMLQALGESYHLTCFKCSKCSICLDGMPFIRDKNRTLFCVDDYHLTYGPRCNKCSNPIYPEDGSNETVRILSMGKTFHIQCYQCEDCSMQLGDEQDRRCYPLEDSLLCQRCCRRRLYYVNKF